MRNFMQLFPIIFLLIATPYTFSSDSFKIFSLILSLLYMVSYILVSEKINFNISLLILIFAPFYFIHLFLSFNYLAALESSLRYFLPIIVLLYSFSVRDSFRGIFKLLTFYMVISFLYQIIIYYNFFNGVSNQWFYHEVAKGLFSSHLQFGVIRASGLLGFFDVYGFFNLIMFFLLHFYYEGKYKYLLQRIAIIALFLSFSFKLIAIFIIICLFIKKFRLSTLFYLCTLGLVISSFFSVFSKDIMNQIEKKISFYITVGNSARAESYSVMFDELKSLNIIGEGVGSFGGPASIKYHSPFYQEVKFNWYETEQLATTDTYFPHLIVELGTVNSFLYFLLIFAPFLRKINSARSLKMILIIYVVLLADSIFTFALNNISYLIFSLFLVYPIIEHDKYNKVAKI